MHYPTEDINLEALYDDDDNGVFDSLYPLAIPSQMGPKATESYYKAQTAHNVKDLITKSAFKDDVGVVYQKKQLLKGKIEDHQKVVAKRFKRVKVVQNSLLDHAMEIAAVSMCITSSFKLNIILQRIQIQGMDRV